MIVAHPENLKPRKTPRQARAKATVDAILEATIQVLLSDGAHRLRTTRVAARAGWRRMLGAIRTVFEHSAALARLRDLRTQLTTMCWAYLGAAAIKEPAPLTKYREPIVLIHQRSS